MAPRPRAVQPPHFVHGQQDKDQREHRELHSIEKHQSHVGGAGREECERAHGLVQRTGLEIDNDALRLIVVAGRSSGDLRSGEVQLCLA